MENAKEKIGWKAHWRIDKFHDAEDKIARALQAGLSMFDAQQMFRNAYLGCEEFDANVALNEGLQELIDIICGLGTPTKWDNTNACLGVGNGTTVESASQTGLLGDSKAFKAMDSGYPQRSGQTAEWRATFGGTEANFSWQEFTVSNSNSDSGKNLNRKVADKGTKSSGETWTLSLQITFS
ncbi:hypothetical protein G4O51_04905 [Candidatus Bathyarchaeota archaeon A05DMB-2]|jgi:hypothetical protein|nr:hypothetical protein [Candidatus Bathyarchaeota archaeon A05DMB-2]